ncbi:hypothetical protein CLOM_g16026 [Closterium sp. NIES-68]|nr:hypothetical protein CLOM_g16026 [Closterium sp. NIES-68]GJP65384.1 hypothetical protein CLOP_g22272 [Closterium sp. NIES-67]GJP78489.1 hypothetical protein CLOP_g8782 [Closterium sp. NIES-67]
MAVALTSSYMCEEFTAEPVSFRQASYPDFLDSCSAAASAEPLSPSQSPTPYADYHHHQQLQQQQPPSTSKLHLSRLTSGRQQQSSSHHGQAFRSLPCIRSGVTVHPVRKNGHVTLMEIRTISPVSIRCVRQNGRLMMEKTQRGPSGSPSGRLTPSGSIRSSDSDLSPPSSVTSSRRFSGSYAPLDSSVNGSASSSPTRSPFSEHTLRKAVSGSSAVPAVTLKAVPCNPLSRSQTLPRDYDQVVFTQ